VIHNELRLPYLENEESDFSGMDCIEECDDKDHFRNYKKKITYQYNSRGFRDYEWPNNLQDAIWCIGDSFTVGMGQPVEERWPVLLQKHTGIKTINISMDGASNDWITRKALYVLENIDPHYVVIQWSYIPRRELSDPCLPDNERRLDFLSNDLKMLDTTEYLKQNIDHFKKCFNQLKKYKVIHTFVPKFECFYKDVSNKRKMREAIFWINSRLPKNDSSIIFNHDQLDIARDGHHYDIKTASKYVINIVNALSKNNAI
jgi:hypothetical protein